MTKLLFYSSTKFINLKPSLLFQTLSFVCKDGNILFKTICKIKKIKCFVYADPYGTTELTNLGKNFKTSS